MSRIGKMPVDLPSGVKASVANGNVNVEGPLGKLEFKTGTGVEANVVGGQLVVSCANESDKQSKANYGTARAVINNMVLGVSKGWTRALELNGVGFVAKVAGQKLTLTVGYSHDVVLSIPSVVQASVEKNRIDLKSCDRAILGNFAATIRKVNPPEPYLGKGIKYAEEVIRRKAGKTGKK